jgi:tripeptide aminopeptidase
MILKDRLFKLFEDLCMINSPSLKEREIVAFVKDLLIREGLEVREDDGGAQIGGNANNLIAWLRGSLPNAPKVFLSAHFDTVEPTEGLEIKLEDGVYSSQSDTILGADDKAGLASAIEAVLALKASGEAHGDVCLLLSCAEEIGLKGAAAVKIDDLDLDFGYVLDTGPPVGGFVTRTANHDRLDITILGKPAHSGKDPEKGINAIVVAAEAINGMKLGRIGPETTANLGIIEGGTATNVVCPKVKIWGEARSTSEEDLDRQIGHMIDRFESAATKFGATVKIEHERHYSSYFVPESHPCVVVGLAASRSLNLPAELRMTLGGSDANIYNNRGLPCAVMATGMEKIHTHDERVTQQSLVETAQLALECLRQAAKMSR